MINLTEKQARAMNMILPKKKSKYNAKKTLVNGISFDSRMEAEKYQELLLLQLAGEIASIELQPAFILQESYIRDGKKVNPIVYKADFKIKYADDREVIMDVKGCKTKEYLIKKKLLLARYPEINFVEA